MSCEEVLLRYQELLALTLKYSQHCLYCKTKYTVRSLLLIEESIRFHPGPWLDA
ncbi:hypothetical protein COAQ111491_08105 [Comamonas aquatilis]